jgi:hypothetical protein
VQEDGTMSTSTRIVPPEILTSREAAPYILAYMQEHCQPWLSSVDPTTEIIYRGLNSSRGLEYAFTKPIRTDRNPMNTPPLMQTAFNAIIKAAGGIANRSNSAFCTSLISTAQRYSNYDEAFIVMPIGPFHYTWSNEWRDWYLTGTFARVVSLMNQTGIQHFQTDYDDGKTADKKPEANSANYDLAKVKQLINVDEELSEAIKSYHEIMISASGLLYINPGIYREYIVPMLANSSITESRTVLPSLDTVKHLKPMLVQVAQQVYDNWDELDIDTYANGGICHLIAEAIASILIDNNITATTVSSDHEQHVYTVVQVNEGVYTVDIPYQYYEAGAGYTWRKLPDVTFIPDDILFYCVSSDPSEFNDYIGYE